MYDDGGESMLEARLSYAQSNHGDEGSVTQSDRDEFVRLLVKHESYVRAYILSLVPHWADAEEAFQETCVRLYRQIDDWDPNKSFRAWACTVAYFEVLSQRKSTRRQRSRFELEFVEAVARQHEADSGLLDARAEALKLCLTKLSATNRLILDLTYRDELDVEQVAERSNRTVAATYKALARVRKLLRDCVERTVRMLERE
jgi:RNA polymerase sigma-70 factor (ECF subfamily)